MSEYEDLVFVGTLGKSRQRVEGQLYIAISGKSYKCLSGSSSLLPLPNGCYVVKNLRIRDKAKMALPVLPDENGGGGMSFPAWSVDIEPLFSSQRELLRIHPDGGAPGTEGCIGVLGNVHECYADIKRALENKKELMLLINHNNNNPNINLKQKVKKS